MGIENPWEKIDCGTDSSGRRIWLNRRTKAMFDEVVERTGLDLVVVQGSFNKGVSDSAGTHDSGGVLDVRSWNLTGPHLAEAILVARRVGFAAWSRTAAQGFDPHQHWVAVGDEHQSPECHAQEVDYLNRRNGLASHAPDDGPWLNPIPRFNYNEWLREADEMTPEDRKWLAEKIQSSADRILKVVNARATAAKGRDDDLLDKVTKIEAELSDAPDAKQVSKIRTILAEIRASQKQEATQ